MEAVDFRKPKNTWHITLTDALELDLKLPTKDLLDDILNISERVEDMDGNEQWEEIYNVAATAVSHNTKCITVTPGKMREIFGIGEVIDFLTMYTEFIAEAVQEKNSRSRTTLNRAMRRAKNTTQKPLSST
ncbi:MAG: hypothetical protein Q4G33_07515 [bacterium]|nr:hypothetical protein [bacterium]